MEGEKRIKSQFLSELVEEAFAKNLCTCRPSCGVPSRQKNDS